MKFANINDSWFNKVVRNTSKSIKEKILSRYSEKDRVQNSVKSTDINVLLNRVRTNQKNESRKKLYFSAAASTGLLIFGFLIF
tara:strand:- start:762 stop:1010 length:249 start_codon:yes stop_codon:yes gene_type:complete